MLAVILVLLGYVYLTLRILFYGLRIINFTVSLAVIAVGFIVIPFWIVHHLTKPRRRAAAPAQQPAPAPAKPAASPAMRECTFRVAGVTFENDDGTSRQEILRHLKFRDEPYAEPDTDLTLDLVETTFEDELAIEVRLNDYQIGFVPRNKISQVKAALDSCAWSADEYSIYGGLKDEDGSRHPFGCEITISWAD